MDSRTLHHRDDTPMGMAMAHRSLTNSLSTPDQPTTTNGNYEIKLAKW